MRRVAWTVFWVVQATGVLCLMGGERFAVSPAGFHCRMFSLWVLEPGFVVMQSVTESWLAYSFVTLDQQYWVGLLLAVALNALLFWLAMLLIAPARRVRRTS